MVMTLELGGARATYQKQKVRTAVIPQSDTSAGVIDWWKGKFPWLNDFADTDLLVVTGTQSVMIENPANYPGIAVSDVPNELLEGSVSAWMNLNAAPWWCRRHCNSPGWRRTNRRRCGARQTSG